MVKICGFLLPLIIFIFLLLFFARGLTKDPYVLPSVLINKSLPNFTAKSLENQSVIITNQSLKDTITLLNVWATWCPACQLEQPLLMTLVQQTNTNVHLYGLNYKDNRQHALAYLTKIANPYWQNIDDPQGKVALQLGVYGTPETFIIDKKGIVRYRYVGALTVDLIKKDLLPRIKKISQEH